MNQQSCSRSSRPVGAHWPWEGDAAAGRDRCTGRPCFLWPPSQAPKPWPPGPASILMRPSPIPIQLICCGGSRSVSLPLPSCSPSGLPGCACRLPHKARLRANGPLCSRRLPGLWAEPRLPARPPEPPRLATMNNRPADPSQGLHGTRGPHSRRARRAPCLHGSPRWGLVGSRTAGTQRYAEQCSRARGAPKASGTGTARALTQRSCYARHCAELCVHALPLALPPTWSQVWGSLSCK